MKESDDKNRRIASLFGVSDIISFITAIIGAFIGVYSFIKNPAYILVSIISSQVLLLIGWMLILIHRIRNNVALIKKEDEIKSLKKTIADNDAKYKEKCEQVEDEHEHMLKQLAIISSAVKSNNIHSNDIFVKIPSDAEEQYVILETLKKISEETTGNEDIKKELQAKAIESAQKYSSQLFSVFNRYCRDTTDEALKLQNAYLELKHIPLHVSITIKLLNKPYHPGIDSIDDISVYTGFRDNAAYNEGEREIGDQLYSISGNTAFITCMNKDRFIINDALKSTDSYSNEHRKFDEFYDCAVVVPIKLKRPDGQYRFFGFLCCDCLNKDETIKNVFDNTAAQYLFAFAQNIATFIETLDANWIDRYQGMEGVSTNILEMLSKKIRKPMNKGGRKK